MSIKVTTLVWQNYNGARQELLTLLALADWCDDGGGKLYPSINAVAKKIRLTESQTRRSVHKLIDQDYLKVVKNHDGGFNKETRHYQINVLLLHVPIYKWDKAQKPQKKKNKGKVKPKPVANADLDDWEDINFSDYGKKEVAVIN